MFNNLFYDLFKDFYVKSLLKDSNSPDNIQKIIRINKGLLNANQLCEMHDWLELLDKTVCINHRVVIADLQEKIFDSLDCIIQGIITDKVYCSAVENKIFIAWVKEYKTKYIKHITDFSQGQSHKRLVLTEGELDAIIEFFEGQKNYRYKYVAEADMRIFNNKFTNAEGVKKYIQEFFSNDKGIITTKLPIESLFKIDAWLEEYLEGIGGEGAKARISAVNGICSYKN